MKLKAIELKGFKSFADRTRIEFLDGVTCVVGPNGCGKSNITDAIRWVLGEQSSGSLRASKMEDVIFNGTEHRPPLHFAEVSLIFDDAQHVLDTGGRELSIKRLLHRSGESTYSINGSNVRLKDVKELLMDTGIGVSGYSLISQGDIEDILKDSKFNRRKIFEEASGISLFDFKKREAERKLYRVEENLTRIRDIFRELDVRMDPLKEASDKAVLYQDLKAQYKAINIHFLLLDYDNHQQKVSELESSLHGIEKQLESITLEEESIREKRTEIQQKLSDLREQEELVSSILQEKRQEREEIIIDVKLTEQRLIQKQDEEPRIDDELVRTETRVRELQNMADELDAQVLSEENQRDAAQQELSQLNDELSVLRNLLERSDEEATGTNQKKHELEVSLSQAKENHHFLVEQMERETAHQDKLKEERRAVKIERRRVEDLLSDLEDQLQLQSESLSLIAQKRSALDEKRSALSHQLSKLQTNRHQEELEQGRLETELQMVDSFSQETKGLSEENLTTLDASLKKRHAGYLLDKLSAKKGYERAVESVLGTYRSTMIFSGGVGELTTFEERFNHPQRLFFKDHESTPLNLQEGHLPFTDILTYKRTDEAWIKALFSHVAFAERYDGKPLSYELVTKEGTLIKRDGTLWITPADHKGHLYRDRSDYFEKLRGAEQRILELDETIDEAAEALSSTETMLQELQGEESLKREDNQGLRESLQQAKEQLGVIYFKEKQLKESDDHLLATLQSHEKRVDQILERIKKDTDLLAELMREDPIEDTGDAKRRFNELLEAQTEKRIDVTKLEESYYHKLRNLQFQKNALLDAKAEHEQLESSRKRLLVSIETLQSELDEKREIQGQIQKDMAEIQDELKLMQEESKRHQSSLVTLDDKREELLRAMTEAKEKVQSLEISEVRLQEKMQQITTELWNQYELSVFAAKQEWDPEGSFQRKQLKQLSLEMLSLEPVNLGAIEEFAELKERHSFLREQMDDLESSKKDIERSIKTLEKTMLESFKATFSDIKEHFKQVFSDLFQGGTGDIRLVDEENILESDILILASPPGKKLTHMNLLSGGEKALTAIALLFSVLRAKPAPFYVLDEIEAALDDYNISRFGNFLEEFSKGSQFIIITHRKGTMQYAKALYGVSMEEKGVSNMVSLQIKERDHA